MVDLELGVQLGGDLLPDALVQQHHFVVSEGVASLLGRPTALPHVLSAQGGPLLLYVALLAQVVLDDVLLLELVQSLERVVVVLLTDLLLLLLYPAFLVGL